METENPASTPTKKRSRKIKWLVFCILLIAAIGVAGWFGWRQIYDSGPIPHNVRKGINFQLYYPVNLPSGYSVDRTSFTRQGNVLIFYIDSNAGKPIGVSEEALPNSLPNQQTNNTPINLPGVADFTTAIGQGHIGLSGGNYISDVITPQTWVLLNVSGYTEAQAIQITQSFRLAK